MFRKSLNNLLVVLLSLLMVSCTSTTTFKDERIKADITDYLNYYSEVDEVSNLIIKSQKSSDGAVLVETSFDFKNQDASFSAEMTLTYEKTEGEWLPANHAFKLVSTNEISAPEDSVVAEFIKKNPTEYFESQIISVFLPEYLTLISKTETSTTNITYVYQYSIEKLNWTFNETYTVDVVYSYPDGWRLTMKDWSYVETSDWNGTWQVKLYKADGTLGLTINDLVISGNLSVSNSKSQNRVEINTLTSRFTYKGEKIVTNPTLWNESTNNGIVFTFDNMVQERLLRLGINMISGSNPNEISGYEYYAVTFDYDKGVITKLK